MDKHIEVIGIDHGWSNMKTVSKVFTTGVKEITTEPAFYDYHSYIILHLFLIKIYLIN